VHKNAKLEVAPNHDNDEMTKETEVRWTEEAEQGMRTTTQDFRVVPRNRRRKRKRRRG